MPPVGGNEAPTGRPRKLLAGGIVAFFVAAVATLGAAFIFVGSLEVATSFDVYGRDRVIPGQPAWFRVWATSNETFDALVGSKVDLELRAEPDSTTALATASALIESRGTSAVALPVPAGLAPGRYHLSVALTVSGEPEPVETVGVELEVAPLPPPQDPDLRIANVHEPQGEGPLVVEMYPAGPVAIAQLPNRVFVRVTARDTGRPVANATVRLTKQWGQLMEGAARASLETDRAGLAELRIAPINDTDWQLDASTPDGRTGTAQQTLSTAAAPLLVEPRSWLFVGGQRLTLDVITLRDRDVLYADVFADDAWLATRSQGITSGSAVVSWMPTGIEPPDTPRRVMFVACFAPLDCDESHARVPLVWTGDPSLSPLDQLAVMLAPLGGRGAHQAWADAVATDFAARAPGAETLSRAIAFAATRSTPAFVGPRVLVRSEEASQARLDTLKAEFRTWGSVLLVGLAVLGGLMIAGFVIGSTAQRRRAMSQVLDEAEADELVLDGDLDGTLARRQTIGFVLEIVTLVGCIIAFAAGLLLLFRML